MSIKFGNAVESAGLGFGLLLLYLAAPSLPPLANVALLSASWLCLWFFSHCLAHLVVGRLLGMSFLYYFVGRSALVKLDLPVVSRAARRASVLGIKVDGRTLRSAPPRRRAAMFAAGATASMAAPWISVLYAWLRLAPWLGILFGAFAAGNVAFTLYFSPRVGDISRARRSLRA